MPQPLPWRLDDERYPRPASAAVTAVMRGNRRSDTRPERRVRSLLHARGYRFRKNHPVDVPSLRVRPDIVFTRQRLAVFIDGCFWHGCPEHGNQPRANHGYWSSKLERNRNRDERVSRTLQQHGWSVLRIWEHVSPAQAAAEVINVLSSGR